MLCFFTAFRAQDHVGIIRTKAIARNYFWFPGIDKSIEDMIRMPTLPNGVTCSSQIATDALEISKSFIVSSTCRFCDVQKHKISRCRGHLFKWFEVVPIKSTTASRTVEELKKLFLNMDFQNNWSPTTGPVHCIRIGNMRSNG